MCPNSHISVRGCLFIIQIRNKDLVLVALYECSKRPPKIYLVGEKSTQKLISNHVHHFYLSENSDVVNMN